MAQSTSTPDTNWGIFTLVYRDNIKRNDISFISTDLQTAIQEGKEFCATMKIRFIDVTPAFYFLKQIIEKKKAGKEFHIYKQGAQTIVKELEAGLQNPQ